MAEKIDKAERVTQNRVIKLFSKELGYDYLGDWELRGNNSNIEEGLLADWLKKQGKSDLQINKAISALKSAAGNPCESLYQRNKAVYKLLRYGVPINPEIGKPSETVQVINWNEPLNNHFAIAQEVTVYGKRQKRPDIVIYINGIAVGVLELKNSRKDLAEGIRQSLVNQQEDFIADFFTTVQYIFAGNDSQGLRYGTIKTPEKYYLSWKEDEQENSGYKLDKYLQKICDKRRFIELLFDFILFDGGDKKLPRTHQYFGIKKAQERIRDRQGGIIWHTQGSGKSIVMVFLARWILENNPHARVLIITDRTELDDQIKRVFTDAGDNIYQTSSGRDLIKQLGQANPRLLCSLVHKFGNKDKDYKEFITELEESPRIAHGEIFVFVDECHRTQSGKLHNVMKKMLPESVFIGFTGTPLLKADKQTSLEIFGSYIHTYKFNEAVEDGVVLDLVYEARDIDQAMSSPQKVDQWFEAKTSGLNDFQKAELKNRWGTMQQVLSSKSRKEKIISDIIFDFSVKPRLSAQTGNAILVASSIYDACCYYELFQKTPFKGKCAVVTSYNPQTGDINTEDTGENVETMKEAVYRIYTELLEDVIAEPGKTKTETYEDWAKGLFIKEPANMKLLIVVDKLLTGFDAPSCTYLYIDKTMQDHGLFQAICRVNRLDGDTKVYGYIVDYKDLFRKVNNAILVYTSELEYDEFDPQDCDIMLQDRLKAGKERLDNTLEEIELLCEPVAMPKSDLDYIHYFCGNTENPDDLKEKELVRSTLYKLVVAFIRAYANIADDMYEAGYSVAGVEYIKKRLEFYIKLRDVIRNASGEVIDLKAYESDMRHLLDTYIQADESRVISPFGDMTLLDIIVKSGMAEAIENLPGGNKASQNAVAETIENNVRSKIIKDHLLDPAYFARMSELLKEIIDLRKERAIEYEEYLNRMAELVNNVMSGRDKSTPKALNTHGKVALYHALGESAENEILAIRLDTAVKVSRPDNWRGNVAKEQVIKAAIYRVVNDKDQVEKLFDIIYAQNEY
ncbi:MAG: HsdR family type I site-specific deoxyribonuclease [Sedimentisphaerales bacterium]|nr:HsdR family type I site-specific deoxyribonuclease [Sedimentisphaerales bacterium]